MKKNSGNFIKTNDKETADKLRELGFLEVSETGSSTATFVNQHTMTFESIDMTKVNFSNTLFV